jgi:GNAT superfamily N-acetyltransferase
MTQDQEVVGVANVTIPGDGAGAAILGARREALWHALGDAARTRYEAFGKACEAFSVTPPHYHLNMIGVRRSHAGQGVGRRLLDAVHDASRRDADVTDEQSAMAVDVGDSVTLTVPR